MEQMKKTARGLDIFFKISQIMCTVIMSVLVVLNILGLVLGYDKLIDQKSLNISTSINGFIINPEDLVFEVMEVRRAVLLMSAVGLLTVFTVWFGIRIVRQILAPMKEGRPFDSSVSLNIRKMAWFTLGTGIIINIFEAFIKTYVAQAMISAYAEGPVTMGVSHQINMDFIVFAFILFLFSYIFRYGEELQKLSDETL
ncbi:MAG: hypothetical protein IJM08_05750 [Firmicutes bacterium]|nr:hypothetical protein [Bacillota bacterium]